MKGVNIHNHMLPEDSREHLLKCMSNPSLPPPTPQLENLVFLLMNNFQASNKKEMMMFKTLESDTV